MLNILSNIPVMVVAASEVAKTISVSGVTGDDVLYLADTFIQLGFLLGLFIGVFGVLFLQLYLSPYTLRLKEKYGDRKVDHVN